MTSYCFVCNRVTDHFAEHDALVEAGLAEYDTTSGDVHRTVNYEPALAAAIAEVDYEHYVRFGYDGVDLAKVVEEARAKVAASRAAYATANPLG